jgi:hypothetical protein
VREIDLAWTLATATDDRLTAAERIEIYVAVGAGDAATAIRRLTSVAIREQVHILPELAHALRTWWAAHEDGAKEVGDPIARFRAGDGP